MKRDINLIELSRDHHHGLLLGWKVRQGLKANVSESTIAEYVQYFADEALREHFIEEEELLLKYLPDNDVYKQRTLKEHSEILDRANLLGTPEHVNAENLIGIAELLDRHIRFEERDFFPYLEKTLSADELSEVGAAITEVHKPYIENFPNEFWKSAVN